MSSVNQFNNNTPSHTTDTHYSFIMHLLHKLDQSLIKTYFILQYIPNLQIQLVRNAPDDGPVRSETCRANICNE